MHKGCGFMSFSGMQRLFIALCTAANFSTYTAASDISMQELDWRNKDREGINVLYLQLKLAGYEGSYEDFSRHIHVHVEGSFDSLKSLSDLSRSIGFPLSVSHLTFSELNSLDTPVVVHMDVESEERGYFALHVTSNTHSTGVVGGPWFRWMQFSNDDFRRNWSGYALVQASPSNRSTYVKILLILAVAFLFVPIFARIYNRALDRTPHIKDNSL